MTVNKYEVFEVRFDGPSEGNPFVEVELSAVFLQGNRKVQVGGFYNGAGTYILRFMPDTEGQWEYCTSSNVSALEGKRGSFDCLPALPGVHGPVRVLDKFRFSYSDGTPYHQVGTTSYVWNHQPEALRKKTIDTLRVSPFNKMRMCIFPKHYDFNTNEPEVFPFERNSDGGFDFGRFDPKSWDVLEGCIRELMALGIEADLILFHPYDRWGFAGMDSSADDRYLRYAVARLASLRNVWWSFANEFDLMPQKTKADWDRFFGIVQSWDPCQHLRSIHNCFGFYDHNKPWVTHCSIQSSDMEKALLWRRQYGKPIIFDECCYEGDIHMNWGNLCAQEMTQRFWEAFVRGATCGHGETYLNDREELWWSKGGTLTGGSVQRIAFYKSYLEQAPQGMMPLEHRGWIEQPIMGVEGQYYLHYVGTRQPQYRKFELPAQMQFTIEIVDTWNMTSERLSGLFSGSVQVPLPGRQYMAIIIRRVE